MSSFTTPLILEFLDADKTEDNKRFKLVQAFQYYIGDEGSGDEINVPAGHPTDFASVPRIFWTILPPVGQYGKAAVVHDYLCDECIKCGYQYPPGMKSRAEADKIFFEAMGVLKVKKWKRYIMFWAVRAWGIIAEFRGKRRPASA